MRKIGLILIGLALMVGAFGFLTFREVREPDRWRTMQSQRDGVTSSRSFESQRGGRSETRAPGREGRARERSQQQDLGGWRIFQMVIDVMNVVVGIVGITLAVLGVRMPWSQSSRQ